MGLAPGGQATNAGVHGQAYGLAAGVWADGDSATGPALYLTPNSAAPSIEDAGLASSPGLTLASPGLNLYWDTTLQVLRRRKFDVHDFSGTLRGQWTHTPLRVSGTGNPANFTTNLYTAGGIGADVALYPLYFWVDLEGVCHLEGAFTTSTPGTVFTLPIGFRPAVAQTFNINDTGGFYSSLQISTAGVAVNSSAGSPSLGYGTGFSWRTP
jgi:hypothetical protein